jgi:hypothetical protein
VEAIAPPGEELMGVSLVAHVPHQLIPGRAKGFMEGTCKLYSAEVGGVVPSYQVDGLNNLLAHFLGEPLKLRQR